jgi:hypothetical protein
MSSCLSTADVVEAIRNHDAIRSNRRTVFSSFFASALARNAATCVFSWLMSGVAWPAVRTGTTTSDVEPLWAAKGRNCGNHKAMTTTNDFATRRRFRNRPELLISFPFEIR